MYFSKLNEIAQIKLFHDLFNDFMKEYNNCRYYYSELKKSKGLVI